MGASKTFDTNDGRCKHRTSNFSRVTLSLDSALCANGSYLGNARMCSASQKLQELAKIIADWSASAPDFTFYLFGSRVRGDHRSDSDVDLHYVLPPASVHASTAWWTNQNCVEDFASFRKVLPGPIKWLEQHAPLRAEVEQGKVVHRDDGYVDALVMYQLL